MAAASLLPTALTMAACGDLPSSRACHSCRAACVAMLACQPSIVAAVESVARILARAGGRGESCRISSVRDQHSCTGRLISCAINAACIAMSCAMLAPEFPPPGIGKTVMLDSETPSAAATAARQRPGACVANHRRIRPLSGAAVAVRVSNWAWRAGAMTYSADRTVRPSNASAIAPSSMIRAPSFPAIAAFSRRSITALSARWPMLENVGFMALSARCAAQLLVAMAATQRPWRTAEIKPGTRPAAARS